MNTTVRIIEDDENVSYALAIRFNAGGDHIAPAFDAVMGMQNALNTPTVALLLDMTMPSHNGLPLADCLNTSATLQDLPMTVFTASHHPEWRQQAMALGGKTFFEKPYRFNYLIEARQASIKHPNAGLGL